MLNKIFKSVVFIATVVLLYAGCNAHAESCFLDGSNTVRCGRGGYTGVSWPVYTSDTPDGVWTESQRRWALESGDDTVNVTYKPTVKYVDIKAYRTYPTDWPDITCYRFINDNGSTASTVCWDTMEVTER